VSLSDRERTIVDSLRDPELMGGIRHLTDVMREYANHPERDFGKLTATARNFASGAAWKRLGYLAEQLWPGQEKLIAEARSRATAGYVRLDPAVKGRGPLMRRWRIQVNVAVQPHARPS
jgi:predicted transcriptional regulator of viral defense system